MDFSRVDLDACPIPPQGGYLLPNHPLYQLLFRDFICPSVILPVNTRPFPEINETDPAKRRKLLGEAKIMAWIAFVVDNPTVHDHFLRGCFHRWFLTFGHYGRAVGSYHIYSHDVKPWNPSMGEWTPEIGPYDHLHPLNLHLPPWHPTYARLFHQYINTYKNVYPLYPVSPLLQEELEKQN